MGNGLWPLRVFWGPVLFFPLLMTVGVYHFPMGLTKMALFTLMFLITGWLVFFYFKPYFWLCLHAVGCYSLPGKGLVLYFKPYLKKEIEHKKLLDLCQNEFNKLVQWFSFAPPKKIAIYLFEREEEIDLIMGKPFRAFAIIQINTAILSLSSEFRRELRHEFAHLFTAKIGDLFPMFKREGIAVWIECNGEIPRLEEFDFFFLKEIGGLNGLLKEAPFLDPVKRLSSHKIAGHFTDFLIQKFGWSLFWGFYKKADQRHFLSAFRNCFLINFSQAEVLWLKSYGKEV